MKTHTLAVIAMLLLLAGGCRDKPGRQPIGVAQPVEGWAGINDLSRDGLIYFAGQPSAEALRAAPARGVRTVVNLRTAREMDEVVDFDEPALAEELGLRYVWIPISGGSLSADDAHSLDEVLRRARGSVLLHCASANRVGALWALYLTRHRNMVFEEALERGRGAGLRSPRLVETLRRAAGPS